MAATLILRTVKGTPLTNLEVDNNFSNISTYANTIDANIGLLASLTTTATGNIVAAVNSIKSDQGNISLLTTTSTSNIVAAINSIKSGNLSQFGSTTSAQLLGTISDETGTGSLVFATTPTLVTPEIGLATGTSAMLTANIGAAAGNVSGNFTAGNFQSTGNVNTASALLTSALTAPAITSTTTLTTKKIVETVVAIGNTGTAANINLSLGTVFTATLNGNATLTIINPGAVSSFTLILTNDATPSRSLAFAGGSFKYPGGAASLARTTTANAIDVWFFMTPDGGTTYYGSQPMKNLIA
jgi:hypothetical protein